MDKFKEYRASIDIDYYVYFTKAYFAFNAYLKAQYPTKNDREKINEMKKCDSIKVKFRQLLEREKHFADDLIALQNNLNTALIKNQGEYILCSKVMIDSHREKELFVETYRRISYDIRAIGGEKFTFNVDGENSRPFKFEELEEKLRTVNLSEPQKNKIRDSINGFVASYSINLEPELAKLNSLDELTITEQDEVIIKSYKGFIEILYSLRNALFHSEVKPNDDVMKVYKFAYFLLRKILHKIPI